jgi:hypothetical protein
VRTLRGPAALCDEIAFWPHEAAAEPDYEILNALRPGIAMLLCASSPYARRGALWDAWRRHHGREGDSVLVWKASTREMNPTVPQRTIDVAAERDPASAAAEWLAEFRTDVESFVSRETLEACVSLGSPIDGVFYRAFVDPSGGSADAMAIAVAHKEKDVVVIDAVRHRKPPFSPEDVVAEFSELLAVYRVTKVVGDRYAGEWPRERFRHRGIAYEASEKSKSDLYRDLLPLINSRRLDLLDAILGSWRNSPPWSGGPPAAAATLSTTPRGGHDDLANAVAGALVLGLYESLLAGSLGLCARGRG